MDSSNLKRKEHADECASDVTPTKKRRESFPIDVDPNVLKASKPQKFIEETISERKPSSQKFDDDWKNDKIKYIVVIGGVISGLGKGVITSSIGALLKAHGYRVTAIKIDPYLNTDAGTMSPFEHGEVYVLDDGGEVDLDLGNYERMMGISLTRDNNITTGKIYQKIIERERRGDFLGKTVQVIPHVTNEISSWIRRVAHTPTDGSKQTPDFCIIELGGTVGDMESMPFIEAIRQLQLRVGSKSFCMVFVSLVPVIAGSQKTKPTQHGVKELRALGLAPDVIACRIEEVLEPSTAEKIALHCHVTRDAVLSVHNVPNLLRVLGLLQRQGLMKIFGEKFHLVKDHTADESAFLPWEKLADKEDACTQSVTIAVVGKYTDFEDAYLSVIKSLKHAAIAANRKLIINWVEATDLEKVAAGSDDSLHSQAWKKLRSADGILVPGGFGERGVEGKILAAGWARKSGIPYLGICLGMQVAVIEFCRNVLNLPDANSAEFDENTKNKVLIYMPEISKDIMGGTMRLGSRSTTLRSGSIAQKMYNGAPFVNERHRHRFEVNPSYVEEIEKHGLQFSGRDGERMEVIELSPSAHPFYFGTQYHPEFLSRPFQPSPPFHYFLLAASGQLRLDKELKTETKQE